MGSQGDTAALGVRGTQVAFDQLGDLVPLQPAQCGDKKCLALGVGMQVLI